MSADPLQEVFNFLYTPGVKQIFNYYLNAEKVFKILLGTGFSYFKPISLHNLLKSLSVVNIEEATSCLAKAK